MSDNQNDYLRDILTKMMRDVEKLQATVEHHQERTQNFMAESSKDRAMLRATVESLEKNVDKLSKILGIHKKKGLWALFIATLTGGAIASGTINYTELIARLFKANGH